MSYVEVEQQGWLSRIGDSIKGILFGILLILGSIPCIFWNETRAVNRAKDLEAGAGAAVSASADKLDAGNQDKLVHVTGMIKVDETLTDPTFGVSVTGLKLVREVEMYQWVEDVKSKTNKKVGGKTETVKEYTYKKEWKSSLQDSSSFKDPEAKRKNVNPSELRYKEQTFTAHQVTLGAYGLSPRTISALSSTTLYQLDKLPESLKGIKAFHLDSGRIYFGRDPANPNVGDMRITYKVSKPREVTVIARQNKERLEAFKTKSMSSDILLVADGKKNITEMFDKAKADNAMMTWILRILCMIGLIAGLSLIFKPLSVVADVIPFIGSLVGTFSTGVAFMLGGAIWMVCTALAWVIARPLIGVLLLVVAGGCIAGVIVLVKKSKK